MIGKGVHVHGAYFVGFGISEVGDVGFGVEWEVGVEEQDSISVEVEVLVWEFVVVDFVEEASFDGFFGDFLFDVVFFALEFFLPFFDVGDPLAAVILHVEVSK